MNDMRPPTAPSFPTSIGTADADSITVLGQDVAADLMGTVGFGELAFWLVALRRPTRGEVRVFEACLVALAEHGLTPSALAARLTFLGAPDALQGAVAAGLLGGGSRFLGATEDTGRYLAAALATAPHPLPTTDEGWNQLAASVVAASRERGEMIPGLGHHLHKVRDPRVERLSTIAREENTYGPHLQLFVAIGRVHAAILGRELALNGAGACGAALADLGLPVDMLRGFSLLARTAGLLGHLAEERVSSIARPVFEGAERAAVYVAPEGSTPPVNGHSSSS